MKEDCRPAIRIPARQRALVACCIVSLLQACTVIGPSAIRSGRMAYNQAIAETNAQQMLMVAVHNRYEESNHLLSVASVTANVRITSKAQIEAGFGNSSTYDGNLVPFSGGVIYEENPTISYRPVTGEAYLRQLASPVPLSLFARFVQIMPNPEFAYSMLLSRVNELYNPTFLYTGQQEDPRFDRLVTLLTALTHERLLQWANDPETTDGLSLLLDVPPDGDSRISELLQLLGQKQTHVPTGRHVVRVTTAMVKADSATVTMTTRSLWELVELFSASVEVPDRTTAMAAQFPALGQTGQSIAVRHSDASPENAYVAVQYRDGWYYIDAYDLPTKRYFKMLSSLWSAAISESLDDATGSPVLTVPVSR